MEPPLGQLQPLCMLACQWNVPEHQCYVHKILEYEQSQAPGKGPVTSVDVCEGSFHIYRTVGKFRASEGLLELDHAAYGRLASQGSAGPVFTLGSSSCCNKELGFQKNQVTKYLKTPHMSNRVSHVEIFYF